MLSQTKRREVPKATQPIYQMLEANEPIIIFQGSLLVESIDCKLFGSGSIRLEWVPDPSLRFTIECDSGVKWQLIRSRVNINCGPERRKFEGVITRTGRIGQQPFTISGFIEPGDLGDDIGLQEIVFHLTNFHPYHHGRPISEPNDAIWDGRATLDALGWRITLDKIRFSALFERLKASGGYSLTHLGKLARADGESFTSQDGKKILDALVSFLSFARGLRVAPFLSVGLDSKGVRVWEEWGPPRASRWHGDPNWFNTFTVEGLEGAFDGFLRRWEDDVWTLPIRHTVHWYVEANMRGGGLEGGIILGQAALELLAYTLLVEAEASVTEKEFRYKKYATFNSL